VVGVNQECRQQAQQMINHNIEKPNKQSQFFPQGTDQFQVGGHE